MLEGGDVNPQIVQEAQLDAWHKGHLHIVK